MHGKIGGDKSSEGIINNRIQQVLDKARQEQVFTSVARTSRPAISVAASGFANGGRVTLAAAVPDVANLGVSIGRMATLVETEVSALARTLRETTEKRATQEAESPLSLESFEAFLATKERDYAKVLVGIINSRPESSFYSPLVSYAAQYATDEVIAILMPPTEVERWDASNDNGLEVMERQADSSISHYDDHLMKWRGVNAGINLEDLPSEERAEAYETPVEGTEKPQAEHTQDYKSHAIGLSQDGQNKLYVQCPQFEAYQAAILNGKPVAPADFLAAAIRHNQPISITNTATKKVKPYPPDGRVDSSAPTQAIKLECTPVQQGALDHITPAGLAGASAPLSMGADCFYVASSSPSTFRGGMTPAGERLSTADCMGKNEACKLLYHNNSLDGTVEQFAGAQAQHALEWGDMSAYRCTADKFTPNRHGPHRTHEQRTLDWEEVRADRDAVTKKDLWIIADVFSLFLVGPAAKIGAKTGSSALGAARAKLAEASKNGLNRRLASRLCSASASSSRAVETRAGYIIAKHRSYISRGRLVLTNRRIDSNLSQATRTSARRGDLTMNDETIGEFGAANESFDTLTEGLKIYHNASNIRQAVLPDGRNIVVRPWGRSGKNLPTLEIQDKTSPIKVRYDEIIKRY